MEAVLLNFDILNLSRYQLQITTPPSQSAVVPKFIMTWTIDSQFFDGSKPATYKIWIIHSQYLVMEAVVLKFDLLNLSRYQLKIIIAPSQSTVVPKLITL
jgi:hypothetical protein